MDPEYLANLKAASQCFKGYLRSSASYGPLIELNDEGIPGRIRISHSELPEPALRPSRVWTRLHFNWTTEGVLRLVPEDFLQKLRKFIGAQDVELGDKEFDRRFRVEGRPVDWVRKVLDPAIRRHLLSLYHLGESLLGVPGVNLDVGPSGLTLICYRILYARKAEFLTFISEGIQILRRFRQQAGERTDFVSIEEMIEEGQYPICGHPLKTLLRRCDRCKTLHHQDCWDYFGGCAIYACDGARRKR